MSDPTSTYGSRLLNAVVSLHPAKSNPNFACFGGIFERQITISLPHNLPLQNWRPAADHMLIGPADVGGHDLQNDTMRGALPAERVGLALLKIFNFG